MWLWVGIVGSWGWVCMAELPSLIREHKMKELMLILLIMAVMTAGGMTYIYMIDPPNPVEWLGKWIAPYSKAIYSLMS